MATSPPYSIEVIPVDRGWILEKIAREIEKAGAQQSERFHVKLTYQPSDSAELTYFLPESAYRDLSRSIRVTYLAHKEDHKGAAALFEQVARKSDYCITSSSKYKQVLEQDGAKEVFRIPLGVDTEVFVPRVRIGVVGRTYSNTGRKGEALLAPSFEIPHVEFVFTGEGWPLPAHYYNPQDLAELYRSLDYLLVPSFIEGGPVPMLEALSSGCPVIAPTDVGMVRDFPHIPFRLGDAMDLKRVIEAEVKKKLDLRAAALPCDWRAFAQQHLELFATLIERRRTRETQPARAPTSDPGPRVALVTHGTEEASKGGPTTRARNIVAHLRARGSRIDSYHNLSAVPLERCDVVHVFNIWPPDSALATLSAARRAGKTVVFSPIALDLAYWPVFHAFFERLLASKPAAHALQETLQRVRQATPRRAYGAAKGDAPLEGIPGQFEKLRLCCDLADRLILLSTHERQFLEAIGARTDHATLVHNGVDVDNMVDADPDLFRRQFSLERYFLCVGRLEYRKNQALAALALRDLDAPLVLVGAEGDPGYVDHIRRLGGSRVKLVDRIEDRRLMASAYAGAEAFVFPTWTEGAPLAAMEAAAAGAPLILGGMSGEREYFGEGATYVHPADVDGLREAARALLARGREAHEAAPCRSRVRSEFSIARHAEETDAVYRAACADTQRRQPAPIMVDASALLHFLRIGQPLSGVPTAEWNIVRELASMAPQVRCVVYNNLKDRFIGVELEDLTNFREAPFNAKYWFAPDDPAAGTDHCVSAQFGPAAPPPAVRAHVPNQSLRERLWRAFVLEVKRAIRKLPPKGEALAVRLIRLGWSDFKPLPPGAPASPAAPAAEVSAIVLEHPIGRIVVSSRPRQTAAAPVAARLLSLGQSWLSNGPLLERLLAMCEERALSLEPYVYDMSYHTGAQYSGWGNNDERYARLLALLRRSRRVYTESRQVEGELQKLRAARGFGFQTRRTMLRGREMPTADPRQAPRYAPGSFVLYVSSFIRRKNHDFLVRIWRELHETRFQPAGSNFRLVLVGEVQDEKKYGDPAVQEELRRSNIDVCASLGDAGLSHLMQQCAFTVYPSLQEGWGLPVQESLLCGKVTLVSDTVPAAQEIENGALIRISPLDYYGWFEAIASWLDNPGMRAAFEQRARLYVPPTWREITESIYR